MLHCFSLLSEMIILQCLQYQGDGTENADVAGLEEETVYVDII